MNIPIFIQRLSKRHKMLEIIGISLYSKWPSTKAFGIVTVWYIIGQNPLSPARSSYLQNTQRLLALSSPLLLVRLNLCKSYQSFDPFITKPFFKAFIICGLIHLLLNIFYICNIFEIPCDKCYISSPNGTINTSFKFIDCLFYTCTFTCSEYKRLLRLTVFMVGMAGALSRQP